MNNFSWTWTSLQTTIQYCITLGDELCVSNGEWQVDLTDFVWQYISQRATLYNWLLNLRRRLNSQLYFYTTGKTKHFLSIKNWTSLQTNTQIFPWISNGEGQVKLNQLRLTAHFSISWTATLILTTGNTKHFLFKNASKKASKMLLKCFKIDSKMQLDS